MAILGTQIKYCFGKKWNNYNIWKFETNGKEKKNAYNFTLYLKIKLFRQLAFVLIC